MEFEQRGTGIRNGKGYSKYCILLNVRILMATGGKRSRFLNYRNVYAYLRGLSWSSRIEDYDPPLH